MLRSRELFDGPPLLRNKPLGAAITIVVLLWFVWAALLMWLFSCTLVGVNDAFRLLGWVVALAAMLFMLRAKRWGLDRWGAFVFGFFGMVPAGMSAALLANRMIGPVEVSHHRIIGLVRSSDSRTFRLKLEGEPFKEHQEVLLDAEADAALWYAESVDLRIRHGTLGYDVLLERTIQFSPGRTALPDLPR